MSKTKNELPKILAVDFDGTLVEDKFPDIGKPNLKLFNTCKLAQFMGVRVILWTCRNNEHLDQALAFCAEQGLVFDAVNDNIAECKTLYNGNTRKVFADKYIDDKNISSYGDSMRWLLGDTVETDLWP